MSIGNQGVRPDFAVEYRFLPPTEGGRALLPRQGYRSEFRYEGEPHLYMGITAPPTPRRLLSPSAARVFIFLNVTWLTLTLLMIFAKPAGKVSAQVQGA